MASVESSGPSRIRAELRDGKCAIGECGRADAGEDVRETSSQVRGVAVEVATGSEQPRLQLAAAADPRNTRRVNGVINEPGEWRSQAQRHYIFPRPCCQTGISEDTVEQR